MYILVTVLLLPVWGETLILLCVRDYIRMTLKPRRARYMSFGRQTVNTKCIGPDLPVACAVLILATFSQQLVIQLYQSFTSADASVSRSGKGLNEFPLSWAEKKI